MQWYKAPHVGDLLTAGAPHVSDLLTVGAPHVGDLLTVGAPLVGALLRVSCIGNGICVPYEGKQIVFYI